MTYVLRGDPDDAMASFFNHVRNARNGGPKADREFRLALISLVEVYNQAARIDPARLEQFRRESGEALASLGNRVAAYVLKTIFLAEDAREDEWYELAMRRSVIQLLSDEYVGTRVAAQIDPAEITALDLELRRVGKEQGPIPEPYVPKSLPGSHWWWHFPPNQDLTEPK
jgi:hypothetical protein